MANQVAGNPVVFDTTGTLTGLRYIRQIQWVDDGDIADEDDMVLTLNGVTLTQKLLWRSAPPNPPGPHRMCKGHILPARPCRVGPKGCEDGK